MNLETEKFVNELLVDESIPTFVPLWDHQGEGRVDGTMTLAALRVEAEIMSVCKYYPGLCRASRICMEHRISQIDRRDCCND